MVKVYYETKKFSAFSKFGCISLIIMGLCSFIFGGIILVALGIYEWCDEEYIGVCPNCGKEIILNNKKDSCNCPKCRKRIIKKEDWFEVVE